MKKLMPFVCEMLVLLLCVLGIVVGLYLGDFFEISIRPHVVSLSACVLLLIVVVWLIVPVFSRGIKALADIVLDAATEINGEILAIMPMDTGPFAERFGKDHVLQRDERYCVVIQTRINKKKIQLSLISTEYPEYNADKHYSFIVSRFSRVLIEMKELAQI